MSKKAMSKKRLKELEENAAWNTTPGTGFPRLGLGIQLTEACCEIRRLRKLYRELDNWKRYTLSFGVEDK